MKIAFAGLDIPVEICRRGVTILQVKNEALFARICHSLLSFKGDEAVEPYSIWDDEGCEMKAASALLVIANPFELPWRHRSLMGSLHGRLEQELLVDEEMRLRIQELGLALASSVHELGFQLNANYGFSVEWNLSSYLKAFSYEVEVPETASLLDNILSFIDLGADMAIDKAFVFINLRTFLTKNDMIALQERLFFHGMSALLLEGNPIVPHMDAVRKYVIDQDFVEFVFEGQAACSSPSQGRFCSNGFGAVTF